MLSIGSIASTAPDSATWRTSQIRQSACDAQIEAVDHDEWQKLTPQFRDHSYRQSWEYGQVLAERRRATCMHVKIRRGGEVLGLADVRIKRSAFLGGIAYISGGPLVRNGAVDDIDRLGSCLDALKLYYVDRAGLILRIQPSMGDAAWNAGATECFTARGFLPATHGHPYRTLLVDLRAQLPDIRSSLDQKWRNCLNKAERNNPSPRVATTIEDFDRFVALFGDFVSRKGLSIDLGADFFREVQRRSSPTEGFCLTTIEKSGSLIAGHLSSMLGNTCVYLLGATSDEALKSNAAYLLQWTVIKLARERGLEWYDLGGIDPAVNPGVYHFKSGMGGADLTAPGPFELTPRTFRARLTLGAESVYRRWRRRGRSRTASHA